MRRLIIAILVLCAVNIASAAYLETFSASNAGWLAPRVNDSGIVIYPAATYYGSGGNPGGYIGGSLSTEEPRLYGFQPADAALYQNLAGLTLTVDFKMDGTVTSPAPALVRFYIGKSEGGGLSTYFVSNNTFAWNPNTDTIWTTHQIALVASNFVHWPNHANNDTFEQVIASPDDIGLLFADEFVDNSTLGFSGSGNLYVDNFGAVPEPTTITLLGLGGILGLLRKRHRTD